MSQPNQHLEKLLNIHRRRLQILESQAAEFGYHTPPHILSEIEDIREKIAQLELQNPEWKRASESSTMRAKVTVLFLSADPTDGSRLRLGQEFREIQKRLMLSKLRDEYKLEVPQFSTTPEDIGQALLEIKPQIVHFAGHGSSHGALCFENKMGQKQLIPPDALSSLFERFAQDVKCVILNACYSESQAMGIASHIEYVIGMNNTITDNAAIAYVIGFYQALGSGCWVEEAHKFGLIQIGMQGISGNTVPILIKKQRNPQSH